MAEIFGAVVSGIGLLQLSTEFLDLAERLKSFYDRAGNAPSLLRNLSHELETVSLLLLSLEQHRQQDSHNALLMERCIFTCGEKAKFMAAQIERLVGRLQRCPRMGRVSVALKDEDIRSLLDEIERWKTLIGLTLGSCQLRYSADQALAMKGISAQLQGIQATSTAQLELSTQHQSLLPALKPCLEDTDGKIASSIITSFVEPVVRGYVEAEDEVQHQPDSKRRQRATQRTHKQNLKFRTRISLPWLTRRVWKVAAMHSQGCWTVSMKTYNVVPHDSAIIRLCKAGDLEAVKALIARGEASPSDCDEYGVTTMEWAIKSGNIQLCRFLLSSSGTLVSDAREIFCRFFEHRWSKRGLFGATFSESMYRLFIEEFGVDVDLYENRDDMAWIRAYPYFIEANIECAKIIIRNQTLPYASRPEQERFELACDIWISADGGPDLMLTWANLDCVTKPFATFCNSSGETALSCAVRMLGYCINVDCSYSNFRDSRVSPETQAWTRFVIELLERGADPLSCGLYYRFRTPLMTLLEALGSVVLHHTKISQLLLEGTQTWASIMNKAGMNLDSYASRKCELWFKHLKGGMVVHHSCLATRPIFGAEPWMCSIELRWVAKFSIYKLQRIPGTWPKTVDLPSTILWKPTANEECEGIWKCIGTRILESSAVTDARTIYHDWDRILEGHIARADDDCSIVALRVNKRKQVPQGRQRSTSQPAGIYRRLIAHHTSYKVRDRLWLPRLHVCPHDMCLRFHCAFDEDVYPFLQEIPVTSCVRGISVSTDCVYETYEWRRFSWEHELTSEQRGRLPARSVGGV